MENMKSFFITGGTTGLGEALAWNLSENHKVGICGRSKDKFLNSKLNNNKNIFFYECDIVDDKFNQVIKEYSYEHGLDVFIANAGIGVNKKSHLVDMNIHKKVTEVNVYGFLNSIEFPISYFSENKKGHLVAISSLSAWLGLPGNPSYCASKAYVSTYMDALSVDLKKVGVYTTQVCPGYVDTPLTENNNHQMPFLLSANEAALRILNAIEKKKEYFHFPKGLSIPTKILASLPRGLRLTILNKIAKFD